MRYVTANGKVVNRIELAAGATWQPPAGEVLEPEDYTPPVEPEPPAVADPMVAKRTAYADATTLETKLAILAEVAGLVEPSE